MFADREFSEAWEPKTGGWGEDADDRSPAPQPAPPATPPQAPLEDGAESEEIGSLGVLHRLPDGDSGSTYSITFSGTWLPGTYVTREASLVAYGAVLGGEVPFELDTVRDRARQEGRDITVADFTETARAHGRDLPAPGELPGQFVDADTRLIAYGALLAGHGTFKLDTLPSPVTITWIEANAA
ncbi:hypothetical protein [Kitasatospora sp. NBC_01300]|uniref:hypothetical protein n=1 Tax=Kitasatospora sp. NBC_01300 TaxID=2903574 RepID=UPI00352C3F78|nr:hypothetical protein OG556_40090 [Kitasatospora sp. NBC_01300]